MFKRIGLIAALAALGVGIYHLVRVRMPSNDRPPRAAHDYDQALNRLKRLQSSENEQVLDQCRTQLLTHGQRTQRAYVFLHGLTNCPYQFLTLGEKVHAQGHNVLLPRYPYHGYPPLSDEQSKLTTEDLIELANEAVDIAQGLGQEVVVCGLSMGGALASWIAQNRHDVERVIALSPALGANSIPGRRYRAFSNVAALVPNVNSWSETSGKRPFPEREHQYPRMASRAVASLMRLGQIVFYQAQRQTPAAASILVVKNPADDVVDHELTAQVVSAWRHHGGQVETYDLPIDLGLGHDYIDPTQPDQQIDAVYPTLMKLLA